MQPVVESIFYKWKLKSAEFRHSEMGEFASVTRKWVVALSPASLHFHMKKIADEAVCCAQNLSTQSQNLVFAFPYVLKLALLLSV